MDVKKNYHKIKNIFGLGLSLAKAQFKLKNEGSYLGVLWYLLNPVISFVFMYSIFSDRLGRGIYKYPLYLLLGIIMFNIFQNSTTASGTLIRVNQELLKSINFTGESLTVGLILENIFSHLFELALFIAVFMALGGNILLMIYYLPILLLFLFFIFGFCLIMSSLAIYFTDLSNIWNFASRILWLVTPIFYDIGGQTRLFYLNLFNPVYYFITIARQVIIYGKMPEIWLISGAFFWSVGFFVAGLLIFNRLKKKLPELI